MKITCPIKSCNSTILLTCPHCHRGALVCNENTLSLSCPICHAIVKSVYCPHGHRIHMGYIREKQRHLRHLLEKTDVKSLVAVLGTFASYAVIIAGIVYVLAYFGDY